MLKLSYDNKKRLVWANILLASIFITFFMGTAGFLFTAGMAKAFFDVPAEIMSLSYQIFSILLLSLLVSAVIYFISFIFMALTMTFGEIRMLALILDIDNIKKRMHKMGFTDQHIGAVENKYLEKKGADAR